MTSIRYDQIAYVRLKDVFDLYSFLKLNDIEVVKDDCIRLFDDIENSRYVVPKDGLLTSIPFVQIVWVWEGINVRYALWSDYNIEIANHDSGRYNSLDRGNMRYDELLLLWEPNEEEKRIIVENVEELKNIRDNSVLAKRDLPLAMRSIREKIPFVGNVSETERSIREKQEEIRKQLNKFTKDFNSGVFRSGNGIEVNNDKARYGGLTVGIDGVNINRFYQYPEEAQAGYVSFELLYGKLCDTIADVYLGRKFLKHFQVPFHLSNSNLKRGLSKKSIDFNCGAFEIKVKRGRKKKGTAFYIDKTKVSRGNFTDALKRALYYESPDQYHKFLEEIKEVPTIAMKLMEEGITINLKEVGDNDPKVIHFDVKRENGEYILHNYERGFVSKNGYKKLVSLKRSFEIYRIRRSRRWNSYFDRWSVYQEFSKAFNKEEALEIVELGLRYFKEAEQKAKEFVESIIKENIPKVTEGEFMNFGRGWFVQGMMNRYFVDNNNKSYFVEPENKRGQYICMFTPARVSVPKHDKIASTILALLSDERISRKVHTLGITTREEQL